MFYFFRGLIGGIAAFFVVSELLIKISVPDQAAIAAGYGIGALIFLAGLGAFEAMRGWFLEKGHESVEKSWKRYFRFTLDHKVIGVQYLAASLVIFLVAVSMAVLMRLELAQPGAKILSFEHYKTVVGTHGISMVVVALIAILGGLGNYCVPLMLGAKDMAFPRLNALSFWLLPPAVILLLTSPLVGGHNFGWTVYPPLSVQGPLGKLFFILAFITAGTSSIIGAVNFISTIASQRAPGMRFFKMPIFVWSVFTASIISLIGTSVVACSLLLVLFDRAFGTSFFDPARGGNVLLYQHLFWFYSHPAVYIMILPAFGVILEILPVFARKPLFAYRTVAYSFIGIVTLSFIVWAHHLFTSGMWDLLTIPFMVTTELISVPTGIVFMSALGTLWLGRIRLKMPMIFALGFIFNFLIGGLTGIFVADVPTDLHFHDTYFVTAHFHYTLFGGVIFALFAGVYYWFPKVKGKMLDETLGRIHFALLWIGFNATFIPMFLLGARGMRRRVADYPPELAHLHLWVSLAAGIIVAGILVFVYNLVRSIVKGDPAPANPWNAQTLEWQTSSPPPEENFTETPVVTVLPYDFGQVPDAS